MDNHCVHSSYCFFSSSSLLDQRSLFSEQYCSFLSSFPAMNSFSTWVVFWSIQLNICVSLFEDHPLGRRRMLVRSIFDMFCLLECCSKFWVPHNIEGNDCLPLHTDPSTLSLFQELDVRLKKQLIGQPMAYDLVLRSIRSHVSAAQPSKSLVLSLHGSTGTGKRDHPMPSESITVTCCPSRKEFRRQTYRRESLFRRFQKQIRPIVRCFT